MGAGTFREQVVSWEKYYKRFQQYSPMAREYETNINVKTLNYIELHWLDYLKKLNIGSYRIR